MNFYRKTADRPSVVENRSNANEKRVFDADGDELYIDHSVDRVIERSRKEALFKARTNKDDVDDWFLV